MIAKHQLEEILTAIAKANYHLDYSTFCKAAEFKEDWWSESKWSDWKRLAESVGLFDPNTFLKILNYEDSK